MKFSTALIATIAAFITDSAVAVSLNQTLNRFRPYAQTGTETDSTYRERRHYAQTETEQIEQILVNDRMGWAQTDIGLGFKAAQTDNPYGEDVEWREWIDGGFA